MFDRDAADTTRHYALGERLDASVTYTEEQLSRKIRSLNIAPEFDEDGVLVSVRPVKKKVLGALGEIRERAELCALCKVVLETSKMASLSGRAGGGLDDSATCTIQFDYVGQGDGGLVPSLYEKDELLWYGRYNCTLRVGAFEAGLYPICSAPQMGWFGGRMQDHERCGPQSWQISLKPPTRLRLIDVRGMCLVDASENDHYVALSYVWGSASTFQTKKELIPALYLPGGLQTVWDEISRTVQDAVHVVRGLNERFLWTDAICIIQDDAADKAELIKDMDNVYARATLTIVAAQGTHANSGLPGIHAHARSAATSFDVGHNLSLLLARAPIGKILLACPWSTRAWTYQESVLSARQLVFTSSTVHFVCCSTTWSEDLGCMSEDGAPPWKFARGTMFDFRSGLGESIGRFAGVLSDTVADDDEEVVEEEEEGDSDPLFDLWTQVVENLSMRNLSFEADILFAAAGLVSVLQKIFKVRSIYGLPERRLEEFLFWSPMEPGCLRRRRDIDGRALYPTWSWAGWVGEISWPEHTARPCGPCVEGIEWLGLPEKGGRGIALQCSGRGTVRDDGFAATSTHGSEIGVELDFPLLQFRTKTARLNISSTVSLPEWISELQTFAWTAVPSHGSARHGVFCITSLNDNDDDHVVGSVVLDSMDVMLDHDSLVATFAILSSVPYKGEQYEGCSAPAFHRVLALRGKEDGQEMERIGHGAVICRENSTIGWEINTVVLA
ncbi:Nn.00g009420.m01.CDS01 [Neocucurbitaria sp. VM-36]